MPPTQQQLKKLVVEARARITWGESPAAVREWLIAEKVYDFDADDILRDLLRARAASMRVRGIRGLFVSAAVFVAAIVVGIIPWWLERSGIPVNARLYTMLWAGAAALGMYGAVRLADGIEQLVRGANAEGADSDVA